MIKLEMKSYNIILIEIVQKYQFYHQAKLICTSVLLVNKYYHLIKKKKENRLNLLILPLKTLLKKKYKQLKIKDKNK